MSSRRPGSRPCATPRLTGAPCAAGCPRSCATWPCDPSRSHSRREHHEQLARPREPEHCTSPAAATEAAARDLCTDLASEVAELPDHYRSIVELRFYENLPPRSVAARLDLPVETVRTRTRRTCELLRTKLDRRYGDRSTWAGLALGLRPRSSGAPTAPTAPTTIGATPLPAATGLSARLAIGLVALLLGGAAIWFASSHKDASQSTSVLAPGRRASVEVAADPARRVAAESAAPPVREAARHTPQVELPVGLRLSGIVVDEAGEPVAGADIWVTSASATASGTRRATADDLGSFELEDVPASSWIGARKPGFAASRLVRGRSPRSGARAAAPREEQIVLTLGVRETRFSGVVRDERGRPIAGARVGQPPGGLAARPRPTFALDGEATLEPPMRAVLTDADGRFELRGLGPGHHPIGVTAAGFASWNANPLGRGVPRELQPIVLGAGWSATGIVRDPDGRPSSAVEVALWIRARTGLSVSDRLHAAPDRTTRTDADGRFVFEHLPGHEIELRAWSPRGYASLRTSPRSSQPGTEHELTLDVSGGLAGRAVEGRSLGSSPLAGHVVVARAVDPACFDPAELCALPATFVTTTDGEGRFRLPLPAEASTHGRTTEGAEAAEVAKGAWCVAVLDPTDPTRALAAASAVGAEDGLLVLTARSGASLAGRITSEPHSAGSLPHSARLLLVGGAPGELHELTCDQGHFSAEGLAAGRWSVVLWAAGRLPESLAEVVLESGERRDLGPLEMRATGSAQLDFVDESGQPQRVWDLALQGPQASFLRASSSELPSGFALPDERLVIVGLAPGKHRLNVLCGQRRSPLVELLIEPGATTALEVVVSPARQVEVELHFPALESLASPGGADPASCAAQAMIWMHDEAGNVYRESSVPYPRSGSPVERLRIALPARPIHVSALVSIQAGGGASVETRLGGALPTQAGRDLSPVVVILQ